MSTSEFISTVNVAILAATFIAVCWYAWEARKTAKEIAKQNDIQLMPFFAIILDRDDNLLIKNAGKGIALNINYNVLDITKKYENISIEFKDIPILEPSSTQIIQHKMVKDGKELKVPFGYEFLTYGDNPMRLKIVVVFEDVLGNKYSQEIFADKAKISPHKIIKK